MLHLGGVCPHARARAGTSSSTGSEPEVGLAPPGMTRVASAIRHLQEDPMSTRRIAAAGLGVATALALASATPAHAQAPTGTLTFHEPASGGTFNIIDNPPKSKTKGARTRFSTKDAIV